MTIRTPMLLLVSLALLLIAPGARGEDREPARGEEREALETVEEIAACADANLSDTATIRTLEFKTRDRRGAIQTSRASVQYAKDEKGMAQLRMQFEAPTDLRGVGLLLLETDDGGEDMFVYLPELNSVRRVRGKMLSGSMFGTDFSWQDLESFEEYSKNAKRKRLADAVLGEHHCYVLEEDLSGQENARYSRIVEYIDMDTCLRVRSELYDRTGELRKVTNSTMDEVSKAGKIWYSPRIMLRDVREGRETMVVLEDVQTDVPIHRRRFSVRDLEARGR